MWLSGSSWSWTPTWIIYTIYTSHILPTTAVGMWVKTTDFGFQPTLWRRSFLGRSHRLHLWLRISPQSHANEGAWGEWVPPPPAWGPWHWGVTAANPFRISQNSQGTTVSLGISVASPAEYSCKNSFHLDSGREVLAATSLRGTGKGVGWKALQGTASIAQYHAAVCHTVPCHAVPAVVRAGAGSRSFAEARQWAMCRS